MPTPEELVTKICDRTVIEEDDPEILITMLGFPYNELEAQYERSKGCLCGMDESVVDPKTELTEDEYNQVQAIQQDPNDWYDIIVVLRFTCGTSFVRSVSDCQVLPAARRN